MILSNSVLILSFFISLFVDSVFSAGLVIGRSKWTITVSSQQAGNDARRMIDGDRNTIWHSQWDPLVRGPHVITINLNERHLVDGVSILPRQDASNNGNIGQHIIETSEDGTNWGHPAAVGTYQNSKETKVTPFIARPARFIRITVLAGAAGLNDPWASIAEINVLQVPDPFVDNAGWTVSADSEEVAAFNGRATQANDGNPQNFWHTKFSGGAPGLPHYYTINQNRQGLVGGLLYTPRQPVGATVQPENGRIGVYQIDSSNDGQNWRFVTAGQWPDDWTDKAAFWAPINVRYIRLKAITEAGNRGPWTTAGDIKLMFGSTLANYQATNPRLGLWSSTVDFPLVPAAAANLWSTSEVLVWSAYANDEFFDMNQGKTQVAIWNTTSEAMTPEEVANTQHDMFCPGVSMDWTGRFIVTGGNDASRTTIYDPAKNQWQRAAEMQVPRGYQGQTTLSDGRIFTIGGSWSGGNTHDKNGEIYDPKADTWTNLPGCLVAQIQTHDHQGRYRADNHQWLFGWKNNYVFHGGPSDQMAWLDTKGQGHIALAGHRGNGDSMNGIAAMYDAIAGKIYTSGGAPDYQQSHAHNHAAIITLGTTGQNVQVEAVHDMQYARGFHTAVILPDGTILNLGGQSYVEPFSDFSAVLVPELYNPVTKQHTQLNPHAAPRTYHSISLLLKDGSVLHAGGGLCGVTCAQNHFNGEIFQPPYLLNDNGTPRIRPVIQSVNGDKFALGSKITIRTDSAVTSIALMRLASATHTVNTDARRVPFTVSGTSPTITLPTDPGVVMPGYYFLFALNAQGTPSVARTIQITFTQQSPASSDDLPGLQVLHTMPDPPPETSVTDFLGVSNLTQLIDPDTSPLFRVRL